MRGRLPGAANTLRLALRLQTHGKPDAYTLDRGANRGRPPGPRLLCGWRCSTHGEPDEDAFGFLRSSTGSIRLVARLSDQIVVRGLIQVCASKESIAYALAEALH